MTAFALVLIIEGLLPFFAPMFWQKTMRDLSEFNPKPSAPVASSACLPALSYYNL